MFFVRIKIILLLGLISLDTFAETTTYEDKILSKVIEAYQIQPFEPKRPTMGNKEKLGQALFFDPILSGPRQVACATCHIRNKGSSDNLRLAVGLGAKGLGKDRLNTAEALVVPRNTLPLFNRGVEDFSVFFWDGRVQAGSSGLKESPLGSKLPENFDSLLSVASVFPLAEADEMLGRSRSYKEQTLTHHAELVRDDVNPDNFQERTLDVFNNLIARLLGADGDVLKSEQVKYRKLFNDAYPQTSQSKYNITHVGNALAAYISLAFELEPASWDQYVKGENSALTANQKQGAIIFYGKGRCVVCHTGKQFSDFEFHGLAVPQLRIGKHGAHLDYGRAAATSRSQDRFAFRTPPLRNVSHTGPWGHNGIFKTLESAIEHHINPVPLMFQAQKEQPKEKLYAGRLLGYRSPILAEVAPLSDMDFKLLVDFLHSLNSQTVIKSKLALPKSVPSGNDEFIRK
jgi:cytochrome c peroxidase